LGSWGISSLAAAIVTSVTTLVVKVIVASADHELCRSTLNSYHTTLQVKAIAGAFHWLCLLTMNSATDPELCHTTLQVKAIVTTVEGKVYGSRGMPMVRSHVKFDDDSDDEYQTINPGTVLFSSNEPAAPSNQ
jgi:hypothetical protein